MEITFLKFEKFALQVSYKDNTLYKLEFCNSKTVPKESKKSDFMIQLEQQLLEYFAGNRRQFSIALAPQGTIFQKKVWDALLEIPYGETTTYGEIAQRIGNHNASRAVGMANHNNPIPILIPCHRVIGKNGLLTGYAGGIPIKKYLLDIEQAEYRKKI